MARERITKKWEIFSGHNKFYCDGRLITGPHSKVFILTVVLITGTSVLFFIFDCKYLAENVTIAIPIVGVLLFIFTMSSLLRTSLTDPGIIPRATPEEAAYVEKQIEVTNSVNSPTYRPPPRTKEVLVKGQTVKLKYCFTCKIFRPPRASHCALCDNCVDRFDHHCPWVGNCVGRRNYRFFYMFIISLAFLAVFIFACAIAHLILITKEDRPFLEAVKESPPSLIVAAICFFSVWSILGLAGFHTYLTTSNQTTNEDIKGSFTGKEGQENFNPYSQGNVCLNCLYILCGPVAPSLLDSRGIVTEDYRNDTLQPFNMQYINSTSHPINNSTSIVVSGDVLGVYKQTSETVDSNSGSVTHLVSHEQPLAVVPMIQRQALRQPYTSQPNLTENVPVYSNLTPPVELHSSVNNTESLKNCVNATTIVNNSVENNSICNNGDHKSAIKPNEEHHLNMLNVTQIKTKLNASGNCQENDSGLSASRLRLLQDTTMIESALDLDSLDGSSLGNNSQAGLMKVV